MNTTRKLAAWAGVLLMSGAALAADMTVEPVSAEQAQHWVRYTVPLPKQIEFTGQVSLPAVAVLVEAPSPADPLVGQAVRELYEALGIDGGRRGSAQFFIRLQLGGPEAETLKQYRYPDQAYRIIVEEDNHVLRCVALGPRGLYYASKTLQQLIKAKADDENVTMPLVRVTDWPDMDDRGLWGSDHSIHLRWMSDRKMNYGEHITSTRVDENKQPYVRTGGYKRRLIDEGPTYGIQPVPVILHLEQLGGSGLFEAYPDLQGKDATKGIICFSNPKFVDVLTQWLVLWADEPNVTEVDVWMSENMFGKTDCQCEKCAGKDPRVLEARAIVAAWERAKKYHPNLGLRVLSSEATQKSDAEIVALLPPDVKLWYYHSLFTYNTTTAPMIGKYQTHLIDAIAQGRWVGVCPNLVAYVGLWQPMTSAAFIHGRMNEFVDKGFQGIIGYAVPRIYYCPFNTEATAEWTWNAKGRSTREFALSYAVRQGFDDPEAFADWSELLGPVSWAVYGSQFPAGEQRNQPGKLADLVRKGKLPDLGHVLWDLFSIPFGNFKTVEQIERNVAQAEQAVELARRIGQDEYLHESLVIQGYMDAIEALWGIKQAMTGDRVTDQAAARVWFKSYIKALEQARTHLRLWEQALPGKPADERLTGPGVELLDEMIDGMKETAAELGVAIQ